MNKLSELMKKIKDKWNSMSKTRKTSLVIIVVVLVIAIGTLIYVSVKPKYAVLFSDLGTEDSGNILANLDSKGTAYIIKGNSILVEESQVDKLRMEMLSTVPITEGSKGFELFDKSSVGATEEESRIMYQRALSGELERTIKAFDEVENAKVNLVLPNDSAFITEASPASASVTLQLVSGSKLTEEQVKAIVFLVSGSVENLDKKDVTIVSDNLNLLTEGIFDEEEGAKSASTENQLASTKQVEKEYEAKILNVLDPIYKDNVKVSVNAELNFDAVKQNNVIYDPKGSAVVSEHNITNNNGDTANTSGSTVDNNMTNTQSTGNTKTTNGGNSEETKNYNNSKKEETVVKAPGEVERITASVVVNGAIDEATKGTITNLVSDAIGYNATRGDGISVESLAFNEDFKTQAEEEIKAMKAEEAKSQRNKLIALGAGGVLGLILVIVLISILRSKKKKNEIEYYDESEDTLEGLNVVVGDNENDKLETVADLYAELNLEAETDNEKIMREVKKYAEKKPEQVAEIIKSWLADDEGR